MASIPFTLAALATSAVPDLEVVGARAADGGDDFVAAVVTSPGAELLVRIPRTQAAEVQQSAELLGLAALTEGPRSRLPFAVPEILGVTRAGDTRAVVTTHEDGSWFEAEDLAEDALLIEPIAEALAAIHTLPQTVALQGGLPVRSARDLRLLAARLVERADATRLLPETVERRWRRAVESAELWDFAPTVVHGSLGAEQLRVNEDRVTAVLGWSELSVGDPASDFAWLLAAGPDVLDATLARYARARGAGSLQQLRTRAALYHELEVARWLLHGTESHDPAVVEDAVAMLDRLVGAAGILGAGAVGGRADGPLGEEAVSAMLDETPEVVDLLSDTAAYEALDEDRMFGVDTDFVEPLHEDAGETGDAGKTGDAEDARETAGIPDLGEDARENGESGGASENGDASESENGGASDAGIRDAVAEQETTPIDPDDLPR